MAINVRWDAPVAMQGAAALATGSAVGQAQGAGQQTDTTKFLLGLRERRREFDINTALRVDARDIEQRQYNQQLAMQDARQSQILQSNELNRQAQLASQQMREEYDLAAQQQYQYNQYQGQQAKTLDEHVFEAEAGLQQMQLNPEGQRLRNELTGNLRKAREFSRGLRPDARNSVMEQWYSDYSATNLGAYEQKEPTAQEEAYANLVPLNGAPLVPGQPPPPGSYLFPVSNRNGAKSWKVIEVPQTTQTPFAEDVMTNQAPAPDGGTFVRQPDGRVMHVPPVKPEKPVAAKPVDMSRFVKDATAALIQEHTVNNPNEGGPKYQPNPAAIKARAKELYEMQRELEAELSGDTAEMEPEPQESMQPVEVSSPEEASQIPIGGTFIFNGQAFRVTGPGEAEPL